MRGILTLSSAEIRLFLRDPFSLVFVLIFPLMMMMLLVAVFGSDPEEARTVENGMLVWRGVTPRDYYTAASLTAIVAALGVMSLPIHLAGYRELGILRRMRASSVPAWALFASQLALSLVVVLVGASLMAFISWLVFDAILPEDPIGVVSALVVGMIAFSAIGFLLAALIPTARAAQGIGLLIFFALWLTSGTAPPRAVLPEGVRTLSDFYPLTYLVISVQDPWFGFGWSWVDLTILAGVAVVAAIPAILLFRWD